MNPPSNGRGTITRIPIVKRKIPPTIPSISTVFSSLSC
jgi:hypothetical protein